MTDLDPWQALRRFTAARIGLGHSGASQPTRAQLDFQLGHARARDAVHGALDTAQLSAALAPAWPAAPCPLLLHSAAADRNIYLQRPDLGRQLDAPSRQLLLARHGGAVNEDRYDLSVVVADGLSALAVMRHTAPLLQALYARLQALAWQLAPVAIVQQGRVAVGDEVGELLGAKIVLVLIGERPGLSSPDSMGLYLTWAPRVGLTDERRNCISNVRPAGLGVEDAADRLHYLLAEAHRRQLSGVHLKDDSALQDRRLGGDVGNFLL
ncbi:MAG: ethanolamine ammonia-lyase subunit EutC [Pseudomonadota bacterium]